MAEKNIEIVKNYDPEVGAAMEAELLRQRGGIELIASENFVSEPVMAAMGSILTNKYAAIPLFILIMMFILIMERIIVAKILQVEGQVR